MDELNCSTIWYSDAKLQFENELMIEDKFGFLSPAKILKFKIISRYRNKEKWGMLIDRAGQSRQIDGEESFEGEGLQSLRELGKIFLRMTGKTMNRVELLRREQ